MGHRLHGRETTKQDSTSGHRGGEEAGGAGEGETNIMEDAKKEGPEMEEAPEGGGRVDGEG